MAEPCQCITWPAGGKQGSKPGGKGQPATASNRAVVDFAASTAYWRVKSISKHIFIIIYKMEFISERYKT